ncbi:hypothetical protein BDZ91DRAFT_782636 [Kalaharituber pfeilii]|nr:hypothetical protein BDZ91DRAFT_782636 [Kalaharituber pfeilii]
MTLNLTEPSDYRQGIGNSCRTFLSLGRQWGGGPDKGGNRLCKVWARWCNRCRLGGGISREGRALVSCLHPSKESKAADAHTGTHAHPHAESQYHGCTLLKDEMCPPSNMRLGTRVQYEYSRAAGHTAAPSIKPARCGQGLGATAKRKWAGWDANSGWELPVSSYLRAAGHRESSTSTQVLKYKYLPAQGSGLAPHLDAVFSVVETFRGKPTAGGAKPEIAGRSAQIVECSTLRCMIPQYELTRPARQALHCLIVTEMGAGGKQPDLPRL